jgi:large subunit ribosomal protein L35
MPKMKTHSGLKKRVKITKSGKIKWSHANQHNAAGKTKRQQRRLHTATYADNSNAAIIKKMLPYG